VKKLFGLTQMLAAPLFKTGNGAPDFTAPEDDDTKNTHASL